jgi:hypothetical protein
MSFDEEGAVVERYLDGAVFVQDLAYDKIVTIRYTTDDWATYSDAEAFYTGPKSGTSERWGFYVDLPVDATAVEYAIAYTVLGETSWDNNIGANYSIVTAF